MPKRNWQMAREKVEREVVCRLHDPGYGMHCDGPLEAAHIIGREHDKNFLGGEPLDTSFWFVYPQRIVPLCRRHHRMYDAHQLDLLGYLTPEEEAQAVLDAGSLESARRRLCPSAYREDTSFISTPEEMAEWERTEE